MNETAKNQLLHQLQSGTPLRSALQSINKKLSVDQQITFGQAYSIVGGLYNYYKGQIEVDANEHLARELDNLNWLTEVAAGMIQAIDDFEEWSTPRLELLDEDKLVEVAHNIHHKNIMNKTKIVDLLFKISDSRMKIFNLYEDKGKDNKQDHSFIINMAIDDDPKIDKGDGNTDQ